MPPRRRLGKMTRTRLPSAQTARRSACPRGARARRVRVRALREALRRTTRVARDARQERHARRRRGVVRRGDGAGRGAGRVSVRGGRDCLESLDPTRGGAEYVPAAAASSLPNELVASVRAAALALAENTASDSSEANLAAVSARARRAAWDALRALPSPEAPETRTPETLIDATAEASTSASDPGVGSFAFAWRCASRFRLPASTAPPDAPDAAMDAVVAALDAGDAMASPRRWHSRAPPRRRSAAGSRRRRRETPELASLRGSRSPSSRRRSPRRRAGGPPRRWRVVCRPRTRASSPCCSRRESTAPPPRTR